MKLTNASASCRAVIGANSNEVHRPRRSKMAALNADRAQDVPEAESQSTLYIAAYGFGLLRQAELRESDYAGPATRS